jgi:DNA transformation protein
MSVSAEFLEYLQGSLAWVPDLRARRMFGGAGLYSGDLTFAVVQDDTLYLKSDEHNAALYRDGGGQRFSFLRQGRLQSMGYWSVPGDVLEESELLEVWARAALEAARRAASSSRRRR